MGLSNNTTRIIVGILAIPVILLVSYLGKLYFLIFILGIAALSFYEFSVMANNKDAKPNIGLGIFAVSFLVINSYRNFIPEYIFFLFFVALLALVELFRNKGSAILNFSITLGGVLYIGLFSSALVAIREFYPNVGELYNRGGLLIISIFSSIWICDSAAYWGGTSLGKHKLFPRVSPKKSWEGSIFGFLFAIIGMILAKLFLIDFISFTTAIAIGLIVGTIGQVGDLIESLFKRDAGVKDSSALIPGHGGVFDRFDSLLYVAPFILIYLNYFGR